MDQFGEGTSETATKGTSTSSVDQFGEETVSSNGNATPTSSIDQSSGEAANPAKKGIMTSLLCFNTDIDQYVIMLSAKLVCDKCNKEYTTKSNLTNHIKEKHGKNGSQEKFSCEYCFKGYIQKSGLQRHVRKHHDPEDDTHKSIGTQTPYCYDGANSWVCAVYVPGRKFPCERHFEYQDFETYQKHVFLHAYDDTFGSVVVNSTKSEEFQMALQPHDFDSTKIAEMIEEDVLIHRPKHD